MQARNVGASECCSKALVGGSPTWRPGVEGVGGVVILSVIPGAVDPSEVKRKHVPEYLPR